MQSIIYKINKMSKERDFSSISTSAMALMQFKAYTQIPFAKQTAKFLQMDDRNKETIKNDFGFWASVVHFENRYNSINELTQEVLNQNILELSSGFNFRGLELTNKNSDIHYIDTDLPEIISLKKDIASSFKTVSLKGKLDYDILNALDEKQFESIVKYFDKQQLTIINEGLMIYFSKEEKIRLCKIIRSQLEKTGGFWVTSDIYLNHNPGQIGSDKDKKWSKYFSKQNVYGQMFESFAQAEEFFYTNGFVLDKEFIPDYSKLSSFTKLIQMASTDQLEMLEKAGKVQATWRLKVKN